MADTLGAQKKAIDVGEVIDSAKFFPVPFGIAVMMIVIMLTDGFDLFTMGYVGPYLIQDWDISRADLGPVNTAGLVGMAIGSVLLGWLGDQIGRKKAYVACLALLFVGSTLCFLSQNLWQLTTFRGLMGLGLGGVTPLAATLISEWTNKRVRSVAVACVIVAVPLGGTLAGVVAEWVIPAYGWRSMFFIGAAAPLVLFVLFSYILPESPKYMAQHPAQHKKLARALNRLLGEKRFDGTEDFYVKDSSKAENASAPVPDVEGKKREVRNGIILLAAAAVAAAVMYSFRPVSFLEGLVVAVLVIGGVYLIVKKKMAGSNDWFETIWSEKYRKATMLIWLAFAVNSFVLYLFTNYLPVLFDMAGESEQVASRSLQVFSLGAFFGAIGGAFLIGIFGSRWIGAGLAFLGVVGTGLVAIALAASGPAGLVLALCLIAGASINGMQAFMYAVAAHSYPTDIRGSAVGMAQTFSRIGAVISPSVASFYFLMDPTPPVSAFLWFIAACALITTISFFLIPSHIPPGQKKAPAAVPKSPLTGSQS